ncbi:uncharacterized protein HMPREF1541_07350 [Cyphellophora europaea CBS 101466]|uniref:ABM domain-containing protein n=1 Tax=Cyphellophora europaea (strain CBS 101466) TaxID=1220924 RepID=W2RMM1_CYPE1|nr:uncharacterized protein HMPREF1541_07350 [Cyphellophora europaea CBS 101466]ETN37727.1 hypothetical protein HMPREF1541_07350 [Cyphellophora europaea CBS 101466]
MAKPYNSVEEQRQAVPIARFVTSQSPNGALLVMNVFIKPDKLHDYVKIVTPVVHKIREMSECQFCEISTHPEDKGHVRIVHSWTKDSAWFKENVEPTVWFGEYIKALAPMRDPNRARKNFCPPGGGLMSIDGGTLSKASKLTLVNTSGIIEHFDRVLI